MPFSTSVMTISYSRRFGNSRVCNESNIYSENCNVIEIHSSFVYCCVLALDVMALIMLPGCQHTCNNRRECGQLN
jgi:hypothetical protein